MAITVMYWISYVANGNAAIKLSLRRTLVRYSLERRRTCSA
jgi:hypothetical protein